MNATPGYPLNLRYVSNHDALHPSEVWYVIALVLDCINKINLFTLEELEKMSDEDLIDLNLIQAIATMIKQEPHKVSKIEEGRPRIVFMVSLIYQIIQRMLYSPALDSQIERWAELPIKVGIGFDPEHKALLDSYVNQTFPFARRSSDVRAYDLSRQRWMTELNDAVHKKTIKAPKPYYDFVDKFEYLSTRQVFVVSNGKLVRLIDPDTLTTHHIQPSGELRTLHRNSTVRVAVSYAYQMEHGESDPRAMAVGDDCIEKLVGTQKEFEDWHLEAGFVMTDTIDTEIDQPYSFCSHLISEDGAVLESWPKMLFNFLQQNKKDFNDVECQTIRQDFLNNMQGNFPPKFSEELAAWAGWPLQEPVSWVGRDPKNNIEGFELHCVMSQAPKGKKVDKLPPIVDRKKKAKAKKGKLVFEISRAEQAQLRAKSLAKPAATQVTHPSMSAAASATLAATPKPTTSNLSVSLEKANRQEKVALGNPNKVGANINRLNSVKNIQPKNEHAGEDARQSKAMNSIMKACDPKCCLSPDAQRYCALLDRPFDAAWGDEGELPVRPLVYEETVPPTATEVCRQFGQTTITIPPGRRADVFGCVGAGNQQNTYFPTVGSNIRPDGDVTGVACVNLFTINASNAYVYSTVLGAPNDGNAIAATAVTPGQQLGAGSFGFWNTLAISSTPPTVNTDLGNILEWGSPAPFGNMAQGDSGQYKYRAIAGGLMITPVDAELSVGGSYDCEVIPNATNDPFVNGLPGGNPYGGSSTISDIWALPDHKIVRGDNMFQVNWLPSRLDYGFKRTQPSACVLVGGNKSVGLYNENVSNAIGNSPATAVAPLTTDVNIAQLNVARNARVVATITPPQDGNNHSYVLSYVSFYEVAGACVQQTATVPRPQPSLGAKVATAVQNDLQQEVEDRKAQVSKGAAFEVMKDHPQIGPMIEKSKNLGDAKSTLTEILDFGKSILPIAEALIL